jgi:hypothetical protein
MKIKSTCGQLPPNVPIEQVTPVTLARSITAFDNVGTEIGQWIGYKETLCQITDATEGELQLVSWGWVLRDHCTIDVER